MRLPTKRRKATSHLQKRKGRSRKRTKRRTMPRSRETTMPAEIQHELLKLMRRLMQEIDAKRYFNEPVDPDALGIPEYRQIIKEPMDLGMVFWKLKDDTYKDAASFFADLHLVHLCRLRYPIGKGRSLQVWWNCQTFNQQGSPVFIASEKLRRSFQTWWNRSRQQLNLDDDQYAFPYRGIKLEELDIPKKASPTRNRRIAAVKISDEADPTTMASANDIQPKLVPGSKFRIKLGRVNKRGHSSKSKSAIIFAKGKEKTLDSETIKSLDTSILILEKIQQSAHGSILAQTVLPPTFVPSLSDICQGLIEARARGWTRCPYSSSRDVLREASLYLSSQSVKNEHRKKTVSACQGLMKALNKTWIEAGFTADVESLKASTEDVEDEALQHESKLRVTKARMEKLKRQEMEKEVKEAENAIEQLEQAKTAVEQAKIKLDKAKESFKETSINWHISYRNNLNQLAEISKEKSQLQKQKEKALGAVKASQVAVERLREKEAALEVLKAEETRILSAIEAEHTKLEVFPKDAVLVDVRHYAKKQKTIVDTSPVHLLELGNYWLSQTH